MCLSAICRDFPLLHNPLTIHVFHQYVKVKLHYSVICHYYILSIFFFQFSLLLLVTYSTYTSPPSKMKNCVAIFLCYLLPWYKLKPIQVCFRVWSFRHRLISVPSTAALTGFSRLALVTYIMI